MTRTFVDDIRDHAAVDPGARAVVTQGGVLRYGQLAERIEALAGELASHGMGPERVCAIAVEQGVDAVVAMSAAIRAGAAFLTVDVELPVRRLTTMLHSGRPDCLVTTTGLTGRLPVDGPTVRIDRSSRTAWDAQPVITPRSLAYVSHTSGSTGTPNPVLIEHRSLDSYLRWVVRDCGLGPDTVALQLAPLGYDASIRDTIAPLLAGGRVVMLPRATVLRAGELLDAVRAYDVNTILSVTPSFLSFLAKQDLAADRLRDLRLVVSSGESLRPFLAAGGRRVLAGRLLNLYGPTETTMTSTRFAVPPQPDTDADLIGTPIDGVVVRLLDQCLTPVPDGDIGEIYLGGIGVARGYGGRPVPTAERFVPDPCGPPGSRLYRTGDLGRRRSDGVLSYLGRSDRQVKIRGYRVEPAEIEGALLTHPAVTGAVVSAATDGQGRTYLLAHVAGELTGIEDAELRAHLAQTLPHHMMPRKFVRLDRMPLTRSGKTDRAALPPGGQR